MQFFPPYFFRPLPITRTHCQKWVTLKMNVLRINTESAHHIWSALFECEYQTKDYTLQQRMKKYVIMYDIIEKGFLIWIYLACTPINFYSPLTSGFSPLFYFSRLIHARPHGGKAEREPTTVDEHSQHWLVCWSMSENSRNTSNDDDVVFQHCAIDKF